MEAKSLTPAFVVLHLTLGVVLGFGGAATAWSANGPHATHLLVLGAFEAIAAVLFLLPWTMRVGAAGLMLACGTAFLVHATMGQWRGDLLVYLAAVVFVAHHGSAYRARIGALT
jgi:hypothetical protein